jgi:hypothetical protein
MILYQYSYWKIIFPLDPRVRGDDINVMIKLHRIIPILASLITLGISLSFVVYLFQLGQARGFNLDEFAYLNWAFHIKDGYVPYRDFLMFTTPLYSVVLSVFFWFKKGIEPVLFARTLGTMLYIGLGCLTAYLFYLRKKSWIAILLIPLFFVIPQPSENLLEIRPDTLGTVFAILGVIFQIHWMQKKKEWKLLLSGLFYVFSTLTLQKTAPFVIIGAIFLCIEFLVSSQNKLHTWKKYVVFIVGIGVPWIIFFLWSILTGNPGIVWYSITSMVFEANKISANYWNLPFYYFEKNPFYFGGGEIGWFFNTITWGGSVIISITTTIIFIVLNVKNHTAGIASGDARHISNIKKNIQMPHVLPEKAHTQFLLIDIFIFLVFIVQLLLYFYWTPLKHPQYLIPIVPFIVYYWGEGFLFLWNICKKYSIGLILFSILLTSYFVFLTATIHAVNDQKFGRGNIEQIVQMNQIWKFIPRDTYVLDLEGRTIYYPYPYYGCCVVFMEFGKYLSHPLPSLLDALENNKPAYIYQEKFNKIGAMSKEEQAYINSHYVPEWGGELWRRIQ